MGEQDMFDLNEQINKWRRKLSQSDTLQKSDVDELESHLREEIERLTAVKLSDQEAFYVARHRLGDTDSLAAEFAKVNTSILWRKRLFWMVAGLLSYLVAIHITRFASACLVVLAWFAGVRGHSLGFVDVAAQMVLFLAVIFVFYQIVRRKYPKGELFCKLADKHWGKFVLFAGVLLIIAVMLASRILVPATLTRMSIQEYSEMAIFRSVTELVWLITMPLILLAAVIRLRPSKLRKAGA
jgi:hypothetical protein